MKLSITTATAILATLVAINAAPAYEGKTTSSKGLTKRDIDIVNNAVANINEYKIKRSSYSEEELAKRESSIVTDVLTAIADTDLAPGILEYIINDPSLSSTASTVIVDVIKSGVISLDTLFTALNNSGLAVQVIQDLISDCQFYAEIYNLALQYIGNLVSDITSILSKRTIYDPTPTIENVKRATASSSPLTAAELATITSLMESLKDSGLASQVVEALVTDNNFYTWGANLIEQLFSSGAISLSEVVEAIAQSGLIPSLFEAFFNVATLKTVVVNALAAALGKCGTPSGTATTVATQSAGVSCKRKRKRRSY
ncbi:hypothetical protein DFJ63DRAFT_314472 [Scheffersomyces coipomensis]|uniref:uncharacterized protein n=1 Tax=Scheffersomyces coipomensis TaxID=1788519 RepID=UPI00315C56B2